MAHTDRLANWLSDHTAYLNPANWRLHWFAHDLPDPGVGELYIREEVIRVINQGTNNSLVLLVACAGFVTDSYLLFANNAILPMLGYVYWNSTTTPSHETAIGSAVLAGCIVGMLIFGYCGDRFGRLRLYGIELLVLSLGTFGLITSAPGYIPVDALGNTHPDHLDWANIGSMNVFSWLIFWRFVSGIGIGGDYPLSSVIVSEFAPTNDRAWMLATLFSMQAVGYLLATLVSLVVISITKVHSPQPSPLAIDRAWRWVMGLGLVPALFAAFLRFFVPESQRYTMDVLNDPMRAVTAGAPLANRQGQAIQMNERPGAQGNRVGQNNGPNYNNNLRENQPQQRRLTKKERRKLYAINYQSFTEYLATPGVFLHFEKGIGRKLAATMLCWFFLDFTFFGLGFNNPQTLSKIWGSTIDTGTNTTLPIWNTGPDDNFYDVMLQDFKRSMITSSIGAIIGSVALIRRIDKINRKSTQIWTFLLLSVLFAIIGIVYQTTTGSAAAVVTLYVITQIFFYYGPNALTFIIPVEIFVTKFRCTCQGLSAAAGKLGSLIVQLFFGYTRFGGVSSTGAIGNPGSRWLGFALLVFAFVMAAGAWVTWRWLPTVQRSIGARYENVALEDLAEDEL